MSSTNRGIIRNAFDYYVTPQKCIRNFLDHFQDKLKDINFFYDPCAGGDENNKMSFPEVLKEYFSQAVVITSDIRSDSLAKNKLNFLTENLLTDHYNNLVIMSNPPFDLAEKFIEKALSLKPKYVIFLLRLSFFATDKRKEFFQNNMPEYCYILANRPSFIPQDITFETIDGQTKTIRKGSKDSSEYALFVWSKDWKENYSKTFVI